MVLDKEYIKKVTGASDADASLYVPLFNRYLDKYGINTPSRVNAFLAQVGQESANLHRTEEYASGADYEGRADLGNIYAGDGVKYKGRSLIMITGRGNYTALSKDLNKDFVNYPYKLGGTTSQSSSPEQLENSVLAALWYWKKNNLNAIADNINVQDSIYSPNNKYWFDVLTKKINGGLNGITTRASMFEQGRQLVTDAIEASIDYAKKNPIKTFLGILVVITTLTAMGFVITKFSKKK